MFSPLMESILEREAIPVVDEAGLDAFAKENDLVMLMVAGDYKRVSATNDVAVILPELVTAYHGHFKACVAARDSEGYFQGKFGFVLLPTLVILRAGEMLGTISGVIDWADYLAQINGLLAGPSQSSDSQAAE